MYRPISKYHFTAKLLEKIVFSFLKTTSLKEIQSASQYYDCVLGYKLHLKNCLYGECSSLALPHISSAFHTTGHQILAAALGRCLGHLCGGLDKL